VGGRGVGEVGGVLGGGRVLMKRQYIYLRMRVEVAIQRLYICIYMPEDACGGRYTTAIYMYIYIPADACGGHRKPNIQSR
jgi:hypothetical protein